MRGLGRFLFLSLSVVLLAAAVSPGLACVGARPFGMGLAFVAVADDVNATYWNPAGLVQLQDPEITYMGNMNAREYINYQDYLAYAAPLGDNSAFAISYIKTVPIADLLTQKWYWVSYAAKVGPNTSLGINLRETRNIVAVEGVSVDSDLDVDLALFHRLSEDATFGLLVQAVNAPDITFTEGEYEYTTHSIENWRPSIALHPDPNTTVAVSLYDALNNAEDGARHFRLGFERIVDSGEDHYLAYRAGYTGIILLDADEEAIPKGPTVGIGYGTDKFRLDGALLRGDYDDAFFLSVTVPLS